MAQIRKINDLGILGKSVWVGNCREEVFAGEVNRDELNSIRELWNHLDQDAYLHDGGRYRARRYAEIQYDGHLDKLSLVNTQEFYQSTAYNQVNGGTRKFSLIDNDFLSSDLLQRILKHFSRRFSKELKVERLELYLHQVRITGRTNELGQPTPEGIHKDGVDFSCQVLFDRKNVVGGESLIYDNEKLPLLGATMEDPLDFYCFSDRDIYHSVSAIQPADEAYLATRDILGIEFCVNREKKAST